LTQVVGFTGPALSRCNRCSCIGPSAFGGPPNRVWADGSFFARYSLCSRFQ